MDNLPAPTPKLTQLMSQQELLRHATAIGLNVEVFLDGYWQTRPEHHVKTAIVSDWMEELMDWHLDQIIAAFKEWRGKNPSKKPNPGHIAQILKFRRGRVYADRSSAKDPVFALDRPAVLALEGAA